MDAEANIRAANGPKGKRRDRRASSSDFVIPAFAGMTSKKSFAQPIAR
jgi:hypothetical protein